MRHSLNDLLGEAYRYFPRGNAGSGEDARATPEYRRQQEAHDRASVDYGTWVAMLRRISARFPRDQHPDVRMENRAVFLQAPGTTPWSRSYKAWLWLPAERAEMDRRLGFQVSFVVPYFMMYVWHDVPETSDSAMEFSFHPSADEQPFAAAVEAEIETTYPGHLLMPPEAGMALVPDIEAAGHGPGDKATVFDCLFSDVW